MKCNTNLPTAKMQSDNTQTMTQTYSQAETNADKQRQTDNGRQTKADRQRQIGKGRHINIQTCGYTYKYADTNH